jgi:predicted ATP-binding protein involved in virulence
MKIKNVKVTRLFGAFDHEIALNAESRITIIIGENGLGKTVLLEMIDSFFKGKYADIIKIEFKEIIFQFDDNVKWILSKDFSKDDHLILLINQINKNGSTFNPVEIEIYEPNAQILAHSLSKQNPYLRRIGPRHWEDKRTREILTSDTIIEMYGNFSPLNFRVNKDDLPKWFKERHETIKVSLIETQRLILLDNKNDRKHSKQVERYSHELKKQINNYLTDSTELSSKLDRTYPNRLISRLKNSTNVTIEDLKAELNKLENKRTLLDAVGLIETEKDSNILEIERPVDVVLDVLMLYVEDSFKKLEIFDPLVSKIRILLEIINKRFKHKQMFIDREMGFIFKSTVVTDWLGDPQEIPISKLSSGEQNELVLFYLLLFKTESNSLILIDEPEVSLHISWQNSFIEDLRQITALNNLDVIIATHSPDIIANNWDLRVELKGLE